MQINKYIFCIIMFSIVNCFGSDWTEIGSPTAMAGQNGDDQLGFSVVMNSAGTIVAVGEPGFDGSKGRVLVYQYTGGDWVAIGTLTAMVGENSGDKAGWSVAINSDGTFVAFGEPEWNEQKGRVRVYEYTLGDWAAVGTPTAMTGSGSDQAGFSVAINSAGTIVAVGEPNRDEAKGRVRVYEYTGGDWAVVGSPIAMIGAAADDQAGYSVAINSAGTIVAFGEVGWSASNGRVRVYENIAGTWTAVGSPTAMTGAAANDQAGYSVAINSAGTIVAVGEYGWDGGNKTGRVRVYENIAGTWTAVGTSDAMAGQTGDDQAGYSVAINSAGTIVAFGEPAWDDLYAGQGRVRVYEYTGGDWTAIGTSTAMTGETADDEAGRAVAINSAGTIVAVGEYGWDDINSNQGRVRVYQYPTASSNNPTDNNPGVILNELLAQLIYKDFCDGTEIEHSSQRSFQGQGAWFSPYRITAQGT